MMVDPVRTPVKTVEQNVQNSEENRRRFIGNFDTFLKVLTTQLTNQNPLEPLDTHQFTAQLVQFASAEQLIAQNSKLDTISQQLRNREAGSALNYLDRMVEVDGQVLDLVNGRGALSYKFADEARSARLRIYNDKGLKVHEASLDGGVSGEWKSFVWRGVGGLNRLGAAVTYPNGTYRVVVSAEDAEGNPVPVEHRSLRLVTNIAFGENQVNLAFADGDGIGVGEVHGVFDKPKEEAPKKEPAEKPTDEAEE